MWLLPGIAALFGGILWLLSRSDAVRTTASLLIEQNGTWLRTVDLARFGQPIITIGPGGTIRLPMDEQTPKLLARLRFESNGEELPRTILETPLTDSTDEWVFVRELHHDDTFVVGDYQLTYQDFVAQQRQWKGEYAHVTR